MIRSRMIGLVVGVVLSGYSPLLPPTWLVLPLIVIAVTLYRLTAPRLSVLAGFPLGLALGVWSGNHYMAQLPDPDCESAELVAVGYIHSLPRLTPMQRTGVRARFEFNVESITPAHCNRPGRMLLSWYNPPALQPGQRWSVPLRLRRPWGLSNPGSSSMQAWYAASGIHSVGHVRSAAPAELLQAASGAGVNQLRHNLSLQIGTAQLPPESTAILKALTVGDRSGIDRRLWRLLQTYGINHLLVISGLHVGMVAGLGLMFGSALARLCWLCGAYRVATLLAPMSALLFAVSYTALAGFSVSTTRALVMLSCFLIAGMLGKANSRWSNFLLALLVVLLLNPLAALGSGFWLSFGAVATLLWLTMFQSPGPLWRSLVTTHVLMSLAMLPLGGFWFGGASVVSAPANLLMIPIVSFYVVPLALLGMACSLLDLPFAVPLWRASLWPLQQLIEPAEKLATSLPVDTFLPLTATVPTVLLAVVAMAAIAARTAAVVKVLALLLVVPLLLPVLAVTDAGQLRLTVLDVGQGTAVVVRQGAHALLYDTGGGDPAGSNMANSVLLPFFRQVGVQQLQRLMISHPDNDHSAGMATVLDAMNVGTVLFGGSVEDTDGAQPCKPGKAWRWPGGTQFQILAASGSEGFSSNDSSCVVQITFRGQRILLPGDISERRERELVRYWRARLDSQWLLGAHHGSTTSSSMVWLKTVQPRHVVFSHGYLNRFGHPHGDVVARVASVGARGHSTASSGALEFTFSQSGIEVATDRDRWKPYWK
jgi:competence protein ComEC